jgi:hypothetical protein
VRGTALIAVLAGLLAGGCALSVEGELPDLEVVQPGISIPGAGREIPGDGDPVIALPVFVQPQERLGIPVESYRSVKVKEVEVALRSGAAGDLSFVRRLRVSLNGTQGFLAGSAATEVASYERPASGAAGAVIKAGKSTPVEVGDAWRDPPTVILVEVAGDLPEQAWTLDVTVRASAILAY